MSKECCICSKKLHTENPKRYFCSACYKAWKQEIKTKAEWVTYLINLESNRRYHEKLEAGIQFIYLGNEYDIAMIDNATKLITKNYDEVN